MTTAELKKMLIRRIEAINDEAFLRAIKTILDSKTPSQIINMSSELRYEIDESIKQVEEGEYLSQDEIDANYKKWLGEK